MSKLHLITGATGLLGSHVARQLRSAGERVRAFVRPTSKTLPLRELGVELCAGHLEDISSIRRAVEQIDIVYHCAGFVGDWGRWRDFYTGNVLATRNLVEACRAAGRPRILHVSSISVYGNQTPPAGLATEEMPIGRNHWLWDYYGRSKVLAEKEIRLYPNHVIVRPSWVYGPGDRNSLPRVIRALRSGHVRIVGSGDNLLNMVFAADVARGAISAAKSELALRKTYHLCSRGELSQRDLVNTMCELLGLPPVQRSISLKLAWRAAFVLELFCHLCRRQRPPSVTRRAIYMIGRTTRFSIEAAARDLGWQPEMPLRKGLTTTVNWHLNG